MTKYWSANNNKLRLNGNIMNIKYEDKTKMHAKPYHLNGKAITNMPSLVSLSVGLGKILCEIGYICKDKNYLSEKQKLEKIDSIINEVFYK